MSAGERNIIMAISQYNSDNRCTFSTIAEMNISSFYDIMNSLLYNPGIFDVISDYTREYMRNHNLNKDNCHSKEWFNFRRWLTETYQVHIQYRQAGDVAKITAHN